MDVLVPRNLKFLPKRRGSIQLRKMAKRDAYCGVQGERDLVKDNRNWQNST